MPSLVLVLDVGDGGNGIEEVEGTGMAGVPLSELRDLGAFSVGTRSALWH